MPVCSPDYLAASGGLTTAADLTAQRLILCAGRADEWALWADAQGTSLAAVRAWLDLDQRTFVMQAARTGQGLAMARRPYADADLAAGRLVMPQPERVPTGYGYFLEVPERTRGLPAVKAFRAWLLAHCRACMAGDGG